MSAGRPKKIILSENLNDEICISTISNENLTELNKKIIDLEKDIVLLKERLNTYASEGIGIGSLYEFRDIVFRKFSEHGWV